jgi:hypothetical protein
MNESLLGARSRTPAIAVRPESRSLGPPHLKVVECYPPAAGRTCPAACPLLGAALAALPLDPPDD